MNLTPEQIVETLSGIDEGIIFADGFDEALLGYAEGWFPCKGCGVTRGVVAMYDVNKCIQIIMDRDGMSAGDASEFFSLNVTGAYVGDKSPVFVTFLREKTDGSRHERKGDASAKPLSS